MKHLTTEITIDAPVQKVWDALMDFESYPEWNPFIRKIEGAARVGEKLDNTIEPPGRKPMNFKPRVLAVKPRREFRWKGKLLIPGLFDGEHYFQLEEMGGEKTKFVHGERFTGLLVGMLWKSLKEPTTKGFESMNEALKERAEAGK